MDQEQEPKQPENGSELFGNPEKMDDRTTDGCISRADVEQTVEDNILCYTHSDRPIGQDPDTECHMAIRTALRMLRKDLRKLPPVQPKQIECEDAISREDAINALKNLDDLNGENVFTKNGLYPWNILKELPPVQPKPKVGHWIFDEILDRNYYCSECKSMGVDYWDYCPYCGAKMAEPQESEEARAL